MPLDIPLNQAELHQLSEAFLNVSDRQISAAGSLSFVRYSERSKELAEALTFATLNDPARATGFAEECDRLGGTCDALADHVGSHEGRMFWAGKKALLLGLADHFHDLAAKAQKRPAQGLLEIH
jgi:hypothetical protein